MNLGKYAMTWREAPWNWIAFFVACAVIGGVLIFVF
jgi:hypothetical protein